MSRACHAAMPCSWHFSFWVFGKLILWIYGVPLSMVRIVGGIILMRIGFELLSPSSSATRIVGFFVSTMGMGLIFHGVLEAIQTYGTVSGPAA